MPIAIKSLTAGYLSAILDWFWNSIRPRTTMRIGDEEDRAFQELRRKIREARVLCPSVESLLEGVRFTGRLSVVVQNGKILKSGYEEGYFTRRQDERLLS
jgi:hypothetical protein